MAVLFRMVVEVAAVVCNATGVKIRLEAPPRDGAVSRVTVVPETLKTLADSVPALKLVQTVPTVMPG